MLTANQEKAIAALLECKSQEEAAASLGLTQRTLANYLRKPEFQKAYRAAINGLITSATDDLKCGMRDAVHLLRSIVKDGSQTPNCRMTAARLILEYGLRYAELTDILTELRTLTEGALDATL